MTCEGTRPPDLLAADKNGAVDKNVDDFEGLSAIEWKMLCRSRLLAIASPVIAAANSISIYALTEFGFIDAYPGRFVLFNLA
ncbi:MAG: hypothetical protein H0T47_23200 [Planctomycetaceae bacterium]|nr:hypothetical protein [Planctomycetaceae bacterium]